ncbi:MAG TPA: 16S rRNA (adenine(1518)-N(6)/adenine(1519)-N(6))-dimethyltransferase RsmA [Thermoanaerobaculia bacterium]|nr:16S rRNA (adenine(1518)-N(6)/adenine(1519)-N(6))-dimethyltransferase RsmA [Thermoanaerobaculia bacterium]
MRPKKKWGQNFLRNRGAVEKIIAAIEPQPGEVILEIGPGEGVLTEKLVELPNEIIAIEIDPELAARLQRLPIEVRNEDALEAPLPDKPFRAVGNLPYNVGTPILRRVIADPNCRRAVFMLQKEVAQRLVAKPGDEQYGFLTLYTAMFASARILMTLGSRSFYPPPKVDSAVVVLDPRPHPGDRDALIDLISASFRMRRKKLVNNLSAWPREEVLRALHDAGLDEGIRAEQMTLEDFDRVAAHLSAPTAG